MRKRLKLEASLYQILQILRLTLFEKTPFYAPFRPPVLQLIVGQAVTSRATTSSNCCPC